MSPFLGTLLAVAVINAGVAWYRLRKLEIREPESRRPLRSDTSRLTPGEMGLLKRLLQDQMSPSELAWLRQRMQPYMSSHAERVAAVLFDGQAPDSDTLADVTLIRERAKS